MNFRGDLTEVLAKVEPLTVRWMAGSNFVFQIKMEYFDLKNYIFL